MTVRSAILALCLALVGAGSILYYHLHHFVPHVLEVRAAKGLGNGYAFGDDFYPIWLTVRQWQAERRDPYSSEMTRQIQTGLFGRVLDPRNPTDPPADYREFAYPAFTELLLWPAATLQFPALRVVLVVALALLTAASVWLWMLALRWHIPRIWLAMLVVLALCNYPVLEGLFAGQPGLIVGFLLASSALALRQGRLLLAGSLLSLTLIKPQMTALAAAYLLLWSLSDRRRTRFWAGFLATTLLLMGASLWIWPRWMTHWTRVLLGYHRYATPPLVSLLPGATLGLYIGPLAIVNLLGVAAWLAWRSRRANVESSDFWLTLSLLLAITAVALLPGQAIHDHVILLPGLLLLLRHWRAVRDAGRVPRALLVLGAIVLFWPWVAAFAVIMVRPWLSPGNFDSTAALSLPIRTAASLPFAVLALLVCATRLNVARDRESA